MTSSNALEETEWIFSLSNSGKSAILAIVISVFAILGGYNGYSVTKDPSFCLPPTFNFKDHYQDCLNLQAWLPDLVYALTPLIVFGLAFLVFRTMLFNGPDKPKATKQIKYGSRDALGSSIT